MKIKKSKPDYFYEQSGVIPYRINEGKCEIMLITSRRKKRWIIPKGIIEEEMKPAESALNEAFEEAGIKGIITDESLGNYDYSKWGGICNVEVFGLEVKTVSEKWPEDYFRMRKWFPAEEAAESIEVIKLKQILQRFCSRIT